jgi:hypothetical protein
VPAQDFETSTTLPTLRRATAEPVAPFPRYLRTAV